MIHDTVCYLALERMGPDMLTTSIQDDELNEISFPSIEEGAKGSMALVGSSFFFVALQSVCTIFGALSGLRLMLGMSFPAVSASTAHHL